MVGKLADKIAAPWRPVGEGEMNFKYLGYRRGVGAVEETGRLH
jgi:hypothetical protein